jgi:hypothetical protein
VKNQDELQLRSNREAGNNSRTQQSEIKDMVDNFENLGIPSFEDRPLKAAWPQRSCLLPVSCLSLRFPCSSKTLKRDVKLINILQNSSHGLSGQKHPDIRETRSEVGAEPTNMNVENFEEQQSKNCTAPLSFKFTFHDVNDGFKPRILTGDMESEDNVEQGSDDSVYYTSRPSDGSFLRSNDEVRTVKARVY